MDAGPWDIVHRSFPPLSRHETYKMKKLMLLKSRAKLGRTWHPQYHKLMSTLKGPIILVCQQPTRIEDHYGKQAAQIAGPLVDLGRFGGNVLCGARVCYEIPLPISAKFSIYHPFLIPEAQRLARFQGLWQEMTMNFKKRWLYFTTTARVRKYVPPNQKNRYIALFAYGRRNTTHSRYLTAINSISPKGIRNYV